MVVGPSAIDFDFGYEEIVHSIMLASSYDRPPASPAPTASTAPVVNLSPSLEGLENAIPPTSPLSLAGRPYYLQLDKPLPETPPLMGHSTAWSHGTSSVGSSSRCLSREWSRYSKDSCPVIVNSGSDGGDLDGSICDQPTSHPESVGKDDGFRSSVRPSRASPDPLEVFLADGDDNDDDDASDDNDNQYEDGSENDNYNESDSYGEEKDRYGLQVRHTILDWTQNQHGPNHYFREKKWDFFPELATPGALPNGSWPSGRPASALQPRASKKRNLSAFDFGRLNLTRGNTTSVTGSPSSERSGLALANNVRNSIRSVVHRTLSKPTTALDKEKEKSRQQPRPSTARRSTTTTTTASNRSGNSCDGNSKPLPQNHEDIFSASNRMRSLSESPRSSTMGNKTPRPRPLAIPLSPYQKYGAAIWDRHCSRISSHQGRFPRYYQNQRRWSSSLLSSSSTTTGSNQSNRLTQTQSNPIFPVSVSPPLPLRSQLQRNTREYVRALQNGTSHMLGALDGAKQRVIRARMDRRRAQLKAQIRLVGPVDPYSVHAPRG